MDKMSVKKIFVVIVLCLIGLIADKAYSQAIGKMESEAYKQLLTKNELKELVQIVSPETMSPIVKDSIVNLIFERTNNPLTFDKTYKWFKANKTSDDVGKQITVEEWKSCDGDDKLWELTNIDFFLNEFRLLGDIDGFGGVISSLKSSIHWKNVNFDSSYYKRDEFFVPMSQLNTALNKTKRMLLTIDVAVFVIETKNFLKFKNIVKKTSWGKIITYGKS